MRTLHLWFVGSLLATCAGCSLRHPVTFSIVDAETGRPVANTKLDFRYPIFITHPADSVGTTGADGKVVIWLNDEWADLTISKAGYLPQWAGDGPYQGLPAPMYWKAKLYLYREPAPRVVLVVPNGYRGPVVVHENAPRPVQTAGQRYFEFHATPGKMIDITGIPLTNLPGRLHSTFTEARYEDGTPIPLRDARTPPSIIAVTRAYSTGLTVPTGKPGESVVVDPPPSETVTYVVGTIADWKKQMKEAPSP